MTRTHATPMARIASMMLALAGTLCLTLTLAACGKQESSATPDAPAEASTAQEGEAPSTDLPAEDEADTDPASTPAEDDGTATAQLDERVELARQFVAVYLPSYVDTGDGAEPVAVSPQEWASACLRYVDPTSQIGLDLQTDPEAYANELGVYVAAQVVRSTQATLQDDGSVVVEATVEGTQSSWEDTITYTTTLRITFNDQNQVFDAEFLG